jgi:CO/xanthine dehydrogenase Mo-binding subunit
MTGVATGFATIAAEVFGVDPAMVRVVAADTASAPRSPLSGGSVITYSTGRAVQQAAESAREKLLRFAAEQLEIDPGDLEIVGGRVRPRGSPERGQTVAELGEKLDGFGVAFEPIEGHGGTPRPSRAPTVSGHLAHVRVDQDSGEVKVLGYVIAQDVGKALNPALVDGQLRGGATQGIGWALLEGLRFDDQGQLLTGSFMDYAMPAAADVPNIETILVEVPAPDGPFGAKGVGEAPVCGSPGAIANAIAAASGIRMHELPMTASKIWAAGRAGPD